MGETDRERPPTGAEEKLRTFREKLKNAKPFNDDPRAYMELLVELTGHQALYKELAAMMRERDEVLGGIKLTKSVEEIEELLTKREKTFRDDVRVMRQRGAEVVKQDAALAARSVADNKAFVEKWELPPTANEHWAQFVAAVDEGKHAATETILANVEKSLASAGGYSCGELSQLNMGLGSVVFAPSQQRLVA